MLILDWTIPLKTVSEANTFEHWTKGYARHKKQKAIISWEWIREKPKIPLPCHVNLIRIAPRLLDADDNLPMAFKYIKDTLAAKILGVHEKRGSIGKADSDPRITWSYTQEKAQEPRQYLVKIQIFEKDKYFSQEWPNVHLIQCTCEIAHCAEQKDSSELYGDFPRDYR